MFGMFGVFSPLPQSIAITASPTFVGLTLSGLTASRAVVTNGSSALASSATTATQVGYLSTTTSDVQNQINGKAASIGSQTPAFNATQTVDLSLGRTVNIDATTSFTLANPTNPTDGGVYCFRILNSGGITAATMAFGSKFSCTGTTVKIPETANATFTVTAVYRSSLDTYFCEICMDNSAPLRTTLTANGTLTVPAGFAITSITYRNTTANAVTGGVRIGTTNGGAEVVVAQAVGANAIGAIKDANILLNYFSSTATQTLYIQTVTSWNSASVNFIINLVQGA